MIVFLLSGVGISSAQANTIKPEHFFDFGYAVGLWSTANTFEKFAPLYDCHTHNDDAFIVWDTEYGRSPQKALDALESHPHAGAIKRCYDTRLTFEAWREVYRFWRMALRRNSAGWNKDPDPKSCGITSLLNIFTRTCTDLPDWRTPENAAEDAADIAAEHKRRAAIANQQ